MSKVRLYGSTSGYVELAAPAVADDGTLTLPTAAAGFGPAGIGSNVVTVRKEDVFTTSSTSFVDITGLSVTITPSSASSKVLLIGNVPTSTSEPGGSASVGQVVLTITGGNLSGYEPSGVRSRRLSTYDYVKSISLETEGLLIIDSPATTSATTYTVQVKTASGTARINQSANSGQIGDATLVAIEVAG